MTTPGPPGLVRPETDPLPDPVELEGGIGQVRRAVAYSAPAGFRPLELDLYTRRRPGTTDRVRTRRRLAAGIPCSVRPDLARLAADPDSRESQLLGVPVGEAPELARRASPVNHVHPGAPPFHIAHGDVDRFVPVAQSRQLADRLRGAGVAVEFTEVPGADHLWMNASDPEEIFGSAMDFSRRVTASRAP